MTIAGTSTASDSCGKLVRPHSDPGSDAGVFLCPLDLTHDSHGLSWRVAADGAPLPIRAASSPVIDPGIVAQVAMVAVAAVVGGAAGGFRALARSKKIDGEEVDRAMAAQRERIELLETQNKELTTKVILLEGQVRALREELDIEKRITARFTGGQP